MRYCFFYLLALSANVIIAQTAVHLSFIPTYQNSELALNETLGGEDIQIETFKYYISNVDFYKEGKKVFSEEDSYHLLDMEADSSLSFPINMPDSISFSHIRFQVGIDSLTNVSGAFGGDLDPTNGMYWTWQSGYINIKLEGVAADCPARHSRFQFHLGGYRLPYSSLQTVELIADSKNIKINVAIDHFLTPIDLKETHQIMSPGEEAMKLAQLFASIFSISGTAQK